jgi:hypothetical protein
MLADFPTPTPFVVVKIVEVTPVAVPTALPKSVNSSDVLLEYTIRVEPQPVEIPEDIARFYSKEEFQWVVVSFDVLEGKLDMQEMWFESRIETVERFYDLDHATGELKMGVQSRGAIKSGFSGLALYQIGLDETVLSWDLNNLNQKVMARER